MSTQQDEIDEMYLDEIFWEIRGAAVRSATVIAELHEITVGWDGNGVLHYISLLPYDPRD